MKLKWQFHSHESQKMRKGLILGLTTETPVVGKDEDDGVCGPVAIVALWI